MNSIHTTNIFQSSNASKTIIWINRMSLFVVFFWFGFLKVISISPAEELVVHLHQATIAPVISINHFLIFLGVMECVIGILWLVPQLTKVSAIIFATQMFTTFLPLIFLRNDVWSNILVPTMTGQYIIKNLVLVASALSILRYEYPNVFARFRGQKKVILAMTAGFLLIVVSSVFVINQFITGSKRAKTMGINYELPKNQLVATSNTLITDAVQSIPCNIKDTLTNEQFFVPNDELIAQNQSLTTIPALSLSETTESAIETTIETPKKSRVNTHPRAKKTLRKTAKQTQKEDWISIDSYMLDGE